MYTPSSSPATLYELYSTWLDTHSTPSSGSCPAQHKGLLAGGRKIDGLFNADNRNEWRSVTHSINGAIPEASTRYRNHSYTHYRTMLITKTTMMTLLIMLEDINEDIASVETDGTKAGNCRPYLENAKREGEK